MASRERRRHGGGVKLSFSTLALLLASRACIGRPADRSFYQEHATAAAAAPASAAIAPDAAQGSTRAAMGGAGVFDFSFSQLQPETPLPDMVPAATAPQHDGEQQVQLQQQVLSPPPTKLSLRECSLGDVGVAEVARSPWVCGATAVRSLSLRQNQVTAAGARALLDALRTSDSGDRLSSLELDFNPLGDAGVQPLPAYLKERAARGGGGLEELSLRSCDVGPAGCRYISSALLKSAAAAKAAAATASASSASAAAEKDDGGTPSSPDSGGDGVVLSVPPPASGIRRLLLAGNQRLGPAGARALASALKKDRSLQVLDLTRCKIGDEGARCLADALRSNSSLRELRLGFNDISVDGASALASLLHAGSSALDSLELQGNHVGDAGATALANGLTGGGTRGRRDAEAGRTAPAGLRSLNLAGNGIGCAGGGALAKALSGGGGGGGGCALEELELAGNALTLSAFQAAQAKKNSSLYKSAGGALSSLLNTFVDESYYSGGGGGGGPGSQDGGGGGGAPSPLGNPAAAPRRCAVAELGSALAGGGRSGGRGGSRPPLVKAVGLGRTGLTEKDASRLAATLRARPLDSPLEEVEVGMNMLSAEALEAVREAVESPAGPDAEDFKANRGRERGQRQRQPWQRQQQQQQPQQPQQRRRQQSGRRDATPSSGVTGRSHQSQPRRRGGRASAADDERAARGEVGEYAPGGSVELGMFGKKLVSFGQERGDGRELDVEVFGKRVRFERPSGSPRSRSRSRSHSHSHSPSPPPPTSPMGESDFEDEDEDEDEDDPWSQDGEVDFGEVSEAAATHGSASSSPSWSSEEQEGEERWSDDDDSDSDDDGTDSGGNDGSFGRRRSKGRKSSGGRDGSSPAVAVRGGGGGGGGGGGEHPAERQTGRRRQKKEGDLCIDGSEWFAGFEPIASEKEDGGDNHRHPPGGAATAEIIEWEAGFEEVRRQRQDGDGRGPSDRGTDNDELERAGPEPSVPRETGCKGDEFIGAGAGMAALAEKVTVKREAGAVEGLQSGTGDAEWCAGFGSVAGGGAAAGDKAEWDAGFDESDFGSGFVTGRGGGGMSKRKADL